jgi:hypothetical protein
MLSETVKFIVFYNKVKEWKQGDELLMWANEDWMFDLEVMTQFDECKIIVLQDVHGLVLRWNVQMLIKIAT